MGSDHSFGLVSGVGSLICSYRKGPLVPFPESHNVVDGKVLWIKGNGNTGGGNIECVWNFRKLFLNV